MDTTTLANHIVLGHFGRRQVRQGQRRRAELQRQQDWAAPRVWVNARINARAGYRSGQLATMVAESAANRDMGRDWRALVAESRAAFLATHRPLR